MVDHGDATGILLPNTMTTGAPTWPISFLRSSGQRLGWSIVSVRSGEIDFLRSVPYNKRHQPSSAPVPPNQPAPIREG